MIKVMKEETIVRDNETRYYVRHLLQLEDFLYEFDSGYTSMDAGRKFNSLDMILITGQPNYLPWYKQTKQVSIYFVTF